MPAVAFTDPELASVGMTIKDAKDAGIEAKAYKIPILWKWSCIVSW